MDLVVKITKRLPAFVLEADFKVPLGKILIISGPSGSGKTTLLRLLAGLEQPDKGIIHFGKKVFVDTFSDIFLPPKARDLALVFQEGVLFPHLSLEKNISLIAKDKRLIEKYLKALGIWHLRKRKPLQVSGGEKQRAALAQALARIPSLLLLDEPFSALDEKTKLHVLKILKKFQCENATTMILVTHQYEDAKELSNSCFKLKPIDTQIDSSNTKIKRFILD